MALFQRFQRRDQLIHVTQDIPKTSSSDDSFVVLVVGLGNIGKKYEGTRHNVGFAVVDLLREAKSMPAWQEKTRFKAHVTESFIAGKKIILAKPTTYMNDSGQAVRALKDFYNIPEKDITIVHDELDLPFGEVREKLGGGSAGNNGIKSLISHVGAGFRRIRVGIRNEQLEKMDPANFVLAKFNTQEKKQLGDIIQAALHKISA